MQIWEKTTNEHLEFLNKREIISTKELIRYCQKLFGDIADFQNLSDSLKPESVARESTFLAAIFKNKYELQRFLNNVLFELSERLVDMLYECQTQKQELDSQIKAEIVKQVKLEATKIIKRKNFGRK